MLIYNLKKGNDRQGLAEYRYKEMVIQDEARFVTDTIGNLADLTFIPIPPSKCRTDAAYDDRMTALLRAAQTLAPDLDYRELVLQSQSTVTSHAIGEGARRPTPDEIMENYSDETVSAPVLSGSEQNGAFRCPDNPRGVYNKSL